MRAFAYLGVALSFAFLAACGKRIEPSPAGSSEFQIRPDLAKDEQTDAAEKALNTKVNEQHEYLRLTLQNSTGGSVDETAILFGEHTCTFGFVGRGASKGYLGWPHAVGENATIQWRDSIKIKREAKVDISEVYNPKVESELMFTIVGTNVIVTFTKIARK